LLYIVCEVFAVLETPTPGDREHPKNSGGIQVGWLFSVGNAQYLRNDRTKVTIGFGDQYKVAYALLIGAQINNLG